MHTKKSIFLAAVGLVMALGAATGASAATPWQDHHPRRVEVNTRLDHQFDRVREERRSGEISGRQAFRLHMADRRIRMQERWFARHHGGHLTRAERARLNHQENRLGHRIG